MIEICSKQSRQHGIVNWFVPKHGLIGKLLFANELISEDSSPFEVPSEVAGRSTSIPVYSELSLVHHWFGLIIGGHQNDATIQGDTGSMSHWCFYAQS